MTFHTVCILFCGGVTELHLQVWWYPLSEFVFIKRKWTKMKVFSATQTHTHTRRNAYSTCIYYTCVFVLTCMNTYTFLKNLMKVVPKGILWHTHILSDTGPARWMSAAFSSESCRHVCRITSVTNDTKTWWIISVRNLSPLVPIYAKQLSSIE